MSMIIQQLPNRCTCVKHLQGMVFRYFGLRLIPAYASILAMQHHKVFHRKTCLDSRYWIDTCPVDLAVRVQKAASIDHMSCDYIKELRIIGFC